MNKEVETQNNIHLFVVKLIQRENIHFSRWNTFKSPVATPLNILYINIFIYVTVYELKLLNFFRMPTNCKSLQNQDARVIQLKNKCTNEILIKKYKHYFAQLSGEKGT